MVGHELFVALLVFAGLLAVVSTVPYTLTAIDYRRRDNGLAYLLLVLGVGVWNLMFIAQILSPDPLVKGFFFGLAVVGAVQSGLGWFLFATTASSTSDILSRRVVYAVVGILGGLSIVFAMTAPAHTIYWTLLAEDTGGLFAIVAPGIGYWLHTALLVWLFAAGAALFAGSARGGLDDGYPLAYAGGGAVTVIAVLGSNGLFPGGFGIGSVAAMSVTTVGWIQAARGQPFAWLR